MVEKSTHKEDVEQLKAKFETTAGDFTINLFVKECPETVWNFVNLAEGRQETEKGGPFYDGLVFHRVIDNFMIQGGCPLGMGYGGPGYQFNDEFVPNLRHDTPGVLSMANAGPGTNGSQFFITLVPCPHLDDAHSVFGKIEEGMDVIEKIGHTQTDYQDRPIEAITINKVSIIRN